MMTIRVAYVASGDFVRLALCSALSVVVHASRKSDLVIDMFVERSDFASASESARRFGAKHAVDINVREITNVIHAAHVTKMVNDAMFFRLVLPEIFRDEASLLYLDADTIVEGDVFSLVAARPAGAAVSACIDLFFPNRIFDTYACPVHRQRWQCNNFNSGVLLFDCPRWLDLQPDWRSLIPSAKAFLLPDQDTLNLLLHDKIGRLPDEWNVPPISSILAGGDATAHILGFSSRSVGRRSREEALELERNAKLFHFIERTKPGNGRYPEVGRAYQAFARIESSL